MPSTLTDQVIATRDLAMRARRLATALTTADDVSRLLRYAEELDAQAVDLDRRANEGG
jgi:ATP-dependent DNA ligase